MSVFQGIIGDLRVVGDPHAAEEYCEEEEDDSDGVSPKELLPGARRPIVTSRFTLWDDLI